jgi:hypothetical protein
VDNALDLLQGLFEFLKLVDLLRILVVLNVLIELRKSQILIGCVTCKCTCRLGHLLTVEGTGELFMHPVDYLEGHAFGILVVSQYRCGDLVLIHVDVAPRLGIGQAQSQRLVRFGPAKLGQGILAGCASSEINGVFEERALIPAELNACEPHEPKVVD